jgi:hypothetical protein
VLLEYLEHEMGIPVSAIDAEATLRDPERLRSLFESFGGNFSGEIREGAPPVRDPREIPSIFTDKPGEQYDITDILACVVDARTMPNAEGHESLGPDFDEYKADYGRSIVTGYARIGGHACGIVANQVQISQQTKAGGRTGPHQSVNMPRVIYNESADKAARFIMDCNQRRIPLVFIHDTTGFMVGRDSEQAGIIRSGAKMVNAMSNCVVPKIVLITGSSYGAGNYAMCGRAFEPFLTLAWPNSKCAVMGAAQATGVLAMIEERSRQRKGEEIDPETHEQILGAVRASYNEQQDIRHGAARGWVDRLIDPAKTRDELIAALEVGPAGLGLREGVQDGRAAGMTGPDVTGDIARGDLGTAKTRLVSFLIGEGYDPALCAEIGDLCRDMLDPTEAGRWYFVSDRPTSEVAVEVDAFVARHGGRPESVLKQIPSKAKLDRMDDYPAAARERFRAVGCDWAPGDSHKKVAGLEADIWDTSPRLLAVRLGCTVGALAVVALLLIGLRTALLWLRSALGIP